MSKASQNAGGSSKDGDPPQLSANLPSTSDIQVRTKKPQLPVDVLLLTVKNVEFLACYKELKDPYRCWFDGLGYVYFGDEDKSGEERVKVALLRCYEGGIGPGGALISVKNAVTVLRPKAVISVGTCSGLNPVKTKLGDVVVSTKLTTYASKVVTSNQEQSTGLRSCVSRRFLDVIKNCTDGWEAPLKNPEVREVEVHRGEFLSGPELVSAECRRKELAELHPQATAIEMEGEGIYTAAFHSQIEWLIVKGISDYADGAQSLAESWLPCASVMAASLVAHILSDPGVFRSWPHYEDSSERSSASESKRESPFPGIHKPKHAKIEDSASAFLEQLRIFYNGAMSQVMITPWDRDNTIDIDDVYVTLSLLRDDRKLAGTTKIELEDYSEIFTGRGHHLIPNRILVYGRPGIGKSTFTKKIAVDWSRGDKEVLKKFSVVLLIKLRDVCNTQDLCAMLKTAELLSADDPTVFDSLYDYILENQEKVLLVLDGYDEYSAEKSSPVHKIWRGSQLRYCAVIVTSRPSKEGELRPLSHVQFEINGFDRGQVKQFALKFLCDQNIDEFIGFLNEHRLWDMAKIPLLLLMLCLTWKEKDRQPTSRANLYESFFQTLFDHATAKTLDQEFRSVDEYKEDLSKLGELAFDALLNDCLYFKLGKLPEEVRLLIKKYIDVGFFQISKLSSSPRPEEIAYFLHKTVQEFLSARFIVQELTNAKKETLTCLSKVDSFEKMKKMTEVFEFVFELSSEATIAVFGHLRMIGEKEGLTEYNFTENISVKELSEDQREFCHFSLDWFLACACSTSDRQAIYPLFLQCVNSVLVIDAGRQLPAVAREHLLRLSTDLPKPDYLFLVAGYHPTAYDNVVSMMRDLETVVVTCYGDTKSVNNYPNLFLEDFFIKNEEQQMVLYLTCIKRELSSGLLPVELLSALTSAPESPPQKPVDHVSQNQDASSSLYLTEKTSDQTHKHSLSFVRDITIIIDNPTIEELAVLNNVLAFVNRPRVVKLKFFTPGKKSHYSQWMNCFSHIRSFHFTDNLYELVLHGRFDLTATCAATIARSLHQAPNLHTLVLSYHTLCSGVRDLAENLHHVSDLSNLRLCNVHMGDQECRLLATKLKHVAKLQVLVLSDNPLGHGMIELSKHLHSVPHLTKLDLEGTQMGEEEVTAVARALKYVPELKALRLSHNRLGRGVSELSQHLSSIPQLSVLDLFGVQMTKKEASELCTAVRGSRITLFTDYHTRDG